MQRQVGAPIAGVSDRFCCCPALHVHERPINGPFCANSHAVGWTARRSRHFHPMETPMLKKLTLAAGLIALGAVASPQMSSAASFSPVPGTTAGENSLVETVQWRGRCRA